MAIESGIALDLSRAQSDPEAFAALTRRAGADPHPDAQAGTPATVRTNEEATP